MSVLRVNRWSPEDIVGFKKIFKLFDQDGSEKISTRELFCCLTSLGCRPTEDDIEFLMRECDSDGSGDIDFSEFLMMLRKLRNYNNAGKLLVFPLLYYI